MDITDILPDYAPDVCDIMGEYLKATSKDGSIYGVGNLYSLKPQACRISLMNTSHSWTRGLLKTHKSVLYISGGSVISFRHFLCGNIKSVNTHFIVLISRRIL